MAKTKRREFLQKTGAALGTLVAAQMAPAAGRVLGANERINIGLIGIGWRNGDHIRDYQEMTDQVNMVGLCDVDQSRLDQMADRLGGKVKTYKDFRALLEQKDVDAVSIATPDHWHCPIVALAAQAGKDIYVEKVLGQNMAEEILAVKAVREHNRIAQIGLQQRSGPHFLAAADIVRSGQIGKITLVHAFNNWGMHNMFHNGPEGMGNPPDENPPEGVDYDMWLGPAPKRPFNKNRFHITHYFNWDYSGGMTASWGIHIFDIVLWVMGPEINRVSTSGGQYYYKHNIDTPDTLEAIYDCPGYTMTYSMRQANGFPLHDAMDHGLYFFGTNGTLFVNRNRMELYSEEDRKKPVKVMENQGMDRQHKDKFLRSIKTRERTDSDIETGHISGIPSHLANISYRVGRSLRWDNEKKTILDDPEACGYLSRQARKPWDLIG